MYVLEPLLPTGEYVAFSSMTSLMEMFVDSLSEKLSIDPRRVVRWTNVGIVMRPKPLVVGLKFELDRRSGRDQEMG